MHSRLQCSLDLEFRSGEQEIARHGAEEQGEPEYRPSHLADLGLPPHRTETFKLSADPLFVEKVRDVVGFSTSIPRTKRSSCAVRRKPRQAAGPDAPPAAVASRASRAPDT